MRFAINYSRRAAELRRAGQIAPDLFKCADRPEMLASATAEGPVYVHFSFRAGRGPVDEATARHVEQLLQTTQTPHVNIHLMPCAADFAGLTMDSRDEADIRRVQEAMLRDVEHLVGRFGRENVVAENALWDPSPAYRIPASALGPEGIERIVRRTGCGLLLDLAHATAAARYLGTDERAYIQALPTDRLREVHVSGLRLGPNGEWHDHYALSEADWILTAWAMDRIARGDWPRPWGVTFEYGGVGGAFESRSEPDRIGPQATALHAMVLAAEGR